MVVAAILVISCRLLSGETPTEIIGVVKQFISPGSSIVQLLETDPSSGETKKTEPAVFESQLTKGKADIAFAETAEIDGGGNHILSVNILQPEGGEGYRKIFAKTYYNKVLFGQNFKTIGFQEKPRLT